MTEAILKLGMPKWGLSMTEGKLLEWLVEEGSEIAVGDEIAEVETEKITGAVESPAAGVLRRRVAGVGDVVAVGGLLGVVAPVEVADAEIDAFVEEFQASFVPGEAEEEAGGPSAETIETPAGRLRVLVQGEGDEVLVLLHGFGGDAENWRFNLEGLADGRTVLRSTCPATAARPRAPETSARSSRPSPACSTPAGTSARTWPATRWAAWWRRGRAERARPRRVARAGRAGGVRR